MPDSRASSAGPARRTLLQAGVVGTVGVAGAAVLSTSGCGLRIGSPHGGTTPTPAPDRSTDERAMAAAAAQADGLAVAYARAVVVRPDLADALRRLAADHSAHLRVLRPLAGGAAATATAVPTATATGTAAGTASGTASGTATGSPSGSAMTATTALSLLAQAERAAGAQALTDLTQTSGPAARLLASVAACTSAHLTLLAGLPATPRRSAS